YRTLESRARRHLRPDHQFHAGWLDSRNDAHVALWLARLSRRHCFIPARAGSARVMTALAINALCKSFGGLRVMSNVSLSIEPGERRLIIGPNGAGKTTLFNLITGELSPDSGSI